MKPTYILLIVHSPTQFLEVCEMHDTSVQALYQAQLFCQRQGSKFTPTINNDGRGYFHIAFINNYTIYVIEKNKDLFQKGHHYLSL